MFVRLKGAIRKFDGGRIMVIPENKYIIAEVTDVDDSVTWCRKIKTAYTGDSWIRHDCFSQRLCDEGDWVKLNDGSVVNVSKAADTRFSYINNMGKTVGVKYTNKKGELNFAPAVRPECDLGFGEFSSTYNKFIGLLDEYYKNQYIEGYARKNYVSYLNHKMGLIELLRKHPNWNEAEKAVVVRATVVKAPDVVRACDQMGELLKYIHIRDSEINRIVRHPMTYHWSYSFENGVCIFKSSIIDALNTRWKNAIHSNTKATRVIRKIIDEYSDVTDRHMLESAYAKLTDLLSATNREIRFVVSANICDYVTMSHGNSWSSCHSFEKKGGWHNGSLSYANDYVTLVAYGLDVDGEETDLFSQRKIFRNLFMLNEDHDEYIQSRLYPASGLYNRQNINTIFNSVLRDCGVDIDDKPLSDCGTGKFENGIGYLQYPDYSRCAMDRFGGNETIITIGGRVYALDTGKALQRSSGMSRTTFDDTSNQEIIIVTEADVSSDKSDDEVKTPALSVA